MLIFRNIKRELNFILNWRNNMNKGEITAVHDDDMIRFLKSIDLYQAILDGKIKCYSCNNIITMDNIQGIVTQDGEVRIYCNENMCYELLLKRGE